MVPWLRPAVVRNIAATLTRLDPVVTGLDDARHLLANLPNLEKPSIQAEISHLIPTVCHGQAPLGLTLYSLWPVSMARHRCSVRCWYIYLGRGVGTSLIGFPPSSPCPPQPSQPPTACVRLQWERGQRGPSCFDKLHIAKLGCFSSEPRITFPIARSCAKILSRSSRHSPSIRPRLTRHGEEAVQAAATTTTSHAMNSNCQSSAQSLHPGSHLSGASEPPRLNARSLIDI